MSTVATIPVISPEGVPGDLPGDKWVEAAQRGFKRATVVTSPEGIEGYIPADKAGLALQRGFTLGPKSQKNVGALPPEGYGESFLSTFGIDRNTPAPTLKDSLEGALTYGAVPTARMLMSVTGNAARGLLVGGRENIEALQNLKQGGPVAPNLAKMAVGNLEAETAFDPTGLSRAAVLKMPEQINEGNLTGAAGTATGVLANAALIGAGGGDKPSVKPGVIARTTGAVERLNTPAALAPETALDAVLPKGFTPSPELLSRVKQTVARMGLTPEDFAGVQGPKNLLNAVDQTIAENRQIFHQYLDPIKNIPADVPKMAPPLMARMLRDIKVVDPELATRVTNGTATLGDLDALRQHINQMTEPSYSSARTYTPLVTRALKDVAGGIRDTLYSKIEDFHNLPDDAISQLKKQEGQVIEWRDGVQKLADDIQHQGNIDASKSRVQKLADITGQVRALVSPEQALAQLRKGVGVVSNTSRLLQHAFSDLPAVTDLPQLPAQPQKLLMPGQPGPIVTPPPADVSGTPVRPEVLPPTPDYTTRAMRQGRLLPEQTGGIPLTASGEEAMRILKAKRVIVRDPRTGRMRVQYVTSGE